MGVTLQQRSERWGSHPATVRKMGVTLQQRSEDEGHTLQHSIHLNSQKDGVTLCNGQKDGGHTLQQSDGNNGHGQGDQDILKMRQGHHISTP